MSAIIGLDLGKFKSVACAYDTDTIAAGGCDLGLK